jgi:Peptidyl-tRNA hydrolase PTH2
MSEEKRIYVVLPKTVHVQLSEFYDTGNGIGYSYPIKKDIEQVPGRQIAQACHVVSKLRLEMAEKEHAFCLSHISNRPITTIILEARNQKEMMHMFTVLTGDGNQPTLFQDKNPDVYGDTKPITAMAVYALPSEVENTLGYLPLWGAK